MHVNGNGVGRSPMNPRRWGVSMALACLVAATAASGQTSPPTSTAATLSVLGGRVELVRPDGRRAAVTSGTSLAEGQQVVTGPDGRALITFLDGTTVTVEPRSEVTVREMDVGDRERSRIRVLITAGTVWARIASLLGGRGTVSLESNTHAAIAHDGLIGAEQRGDGTFVCWTRAGTVELTDAAGGAHGTLEPGQKATLSPGGRAVTESFSVHRSMLEIVARGPVLPLVVMPDGVRLAGFAEPGIEVNQVFGSLTAEGAGEARRVEVPGGQAGPFLVYLTGTGDGPFAVTVTGRVRGRPVYQREWTGSIARGRRLVGGVIQDFDVRLPVPASEAEILRGTTSPLRATSEKPPGVLLLSPREMGAPARR